METAEDHHDHQVVLHGISWAQYVALSETRTSAQPRMYFLDGELELMSTSFPHEHAKKTIARCLEVWAEHAGIPLEGYGHATRRKRRKKSGAEPDESYILGEPSERMPDLVIEVVWTHGGIDKLEIYRRLGVGEVWLWDAGQIDGYVLKRDKWVRRSDSVLLPDVDLRLFERCVAEGSQTRALKLLRAALKH